MNTCHHNMQERGYSRAASREKADLGLHQYLPFCGIHRFTLLVAGIFRLLESFLLGEQSLEVATGSLEENSKNVHQYTTKYKGRLEKPEEFGNMVIRSLPNGIFVSCDEISLHQAHRHPVVAVQQICHRVSVPAQQ